MVSAARREVCQATGLGPAPKVFSFEQLRMTTDNQASSVFALFAQMDGLTIGRPRAILFYLC
jgi:hypothetical protein